MNKKNLIIITVLSLIITFIKTDRNVFLGGDIYLNNPFFLEPTLFLFGQKYMVPGYIFLQVLFWFFALWIVLSIYHRVIKKTFFIILVLSVILWFLSTIAHAYKTLFLDGLIGNTFMGGGCNLTGYPIALCLNEFEDPITFYLLNISFWFAILFLIKNLKQKYF